VKLLAYRIFDPAKARTPSGLPPLIAIGESMTMKERAIERWENEGGEIPKGLFQR
jgi:hypothetical protein